jgi:hypothetical protein
MCNRVKIIGIRTDNNKIIQECYPARYLITYLGNSEITYEENRVYDNFITEQNKIKREKEKEIEREKLRDKDIARYNNYLEECNRIWSLKNEYEKNEFYQEK